LRIDRVFISANPYNIKVARAIADDENYRRGVVEIIWDDSLLQDESNEHDDSSGDTVSEDDSHDEPPAWFRRKIQKNLAYILNQRRSPDNRSLPMHVAKAQRAAALMSAKEAWSYYQTLVRQQGVILRSGEAAADISALHYALERFPSLKRITITPAAHGVLFHPLYETPMIRAFPRDFNYPIPYDWFLKRTAVMEPQAFPPGNLRFPFQHTWRGFHIVTRALAEVRDHRVTELVLDACTLLCGITCRIFDGNCREYDDLVTLLRRPGFRRLDLALIVGQEGHRDWVSFRNGNLSQMLAAARDLEHVSLSTTVDPDPVYDSEGGGDGHERNLIPLKSIFPVDKWPRLRHLKLSRFLVKQSDVVGFLVALPETLRSVELSFLLFLDGGGNYKDMLDEMRERLTSWREREEWSRPRVTIGIEWRPGVVLMGRAIWVDREIGEFLYGAGENPFARGPTKNRIPYGCGVVRDVFEPEYERPYANWETMENLGYYPKSKRRVKERT
jgi:hypothetical protein